MRERFSRGEKNIAKYDLLEKRMTLLQQPSKKYKTSSPMIFASKLYHKRFFDPLAHLTILAALPLFREHETAVCVLISLLFCTLIEDAILSK